MLYAYAAIANGIPGATLTPEDPLAGLNELARQVKASGVTHISGDVVIDDRLFKVDREQNPDTPTTPTRVHVYVDGRGAASVPADLSRPDVARVHPSAGPLHGFTTSVRAGPGAHSVCVYAIDTSGSGNTRLGCRTATVPTGG